MVSVRALLDCEARCLPESVSKLWSLALPRKPRASGGGLAGVPLGVIARGRFAEAVIELHLLFPEAPPLSATRSPAGNYFLVMFHEYIKQRKASNRSTYGYLLPRTHEIWKGLTDGPREMHFQIIRVNCNHLPRANEI